MTKKVQLSKKDKKHSIFVVLYSGGYDSTCVAMRLLAEDKKRKVILLILKTWFMGFTKGRKFYKRLQERFGEDRVELRIVKSDILKRIFSKGFWYQATYGIPSGQWCAYCNVAMHISAVIFCLENGFNNVADGANKWQAYRIPIQQRAACELYRQFYSNFSINYLNPVFEYKSTRRELYKMGVLTRNEFINTYRIKQDGKLTLGKLFWKTTRNFFWEITGRYPQVQCHIVIYRNYFIQVRAFFAWISTKIRNKPFNIVKVVKPELLLNGENESGKSHKEALYPPIKLEDIEQKLLMGKEIIEDYFNQKNIITTSSKNK